MKTPPAISRFLAVSLGMAEDAVGKGTVSRAIAAAMRREGISDLQAYERLFSSSEDLRQRLIDAVVVGETWFFRDRGPFTCLARHARELREAGAGNVLKILSVPCSTGEEPYSIVMTLLAAGVPPSAFTVEGVDISVQALEKARQACYGSGAFRGAIGADVAQYFQLTAEGRQVTKQVTRQVIFHQDNLLSEESLAGRGPYAIIFCRNLLIYLTTGARHQVFERLDRLLLPGGLLIAGHTETIFWQQQGYLPLQWNRGFTLTKPALSPSPKMTTATTLPKSSPLPGMPRREKNTPAVDNTPFNGKTLAVPWPRDRVPGRQQPIKPGAGMTDAGPEKPLPAEPLQEAHRLADRGDLDGAMHLCQEYARTAGPVAETYCLMGVIHMTRHDMNFAEDCFLKALYLDPGHYESLVHISLIYRQKGNERKAALYRERACRKADRQ